MRTRPRPGRLSLGSGLLALSMVTVGLVARWRLRRRAIQTFTAPATIAARNAPEMMAPMSPAELAPGDVLGTGWSWAPPPMPG
jgi:hypothetical protein